MCVTQTSVLLVRIQWRPESRLKPLKSDVVYFENLVGKYDLFGFSGHSWTRHARQTVRETASVTSVVSTSAITLIPPPSRRIYRRDVHSDRHRIHFRRAAEYRVLVSSECSRHRS